MKSAKQQTRPQSSSVYSSSQKQQMDAPFYPDSYSQIKHQQSKDRKPFPFQPFDQNNLKAQALIQPAQFYQQTPIATSSAKPAYKKSATTTALLPTSTAPGVDLKLKQSKPIDNSQSYANLKPQYSTSGSKDAFHHY